MYYFFVISILIHVVQCGKSFRNDYTYEKTLDLWVKVHHVPATWFNARLQCHHEGAILASPLTKYLPAMMGELIKNDVHSVFTGFSSGYNNGAFFSVEGVPLEAVHLSLSYDPDISESNAQCVALFPNGSMTFVSCERPRPYICYRSGSNMPEVNQCGTIDPEYAIDYRTQHCYKFHKFGQTWTNASLTCTAEGGYLVIINSETEAEVLRDIMQKYPAKDIMAFYKDFIGVGFLDWSAKGTMWRTVHGQTLKEAGYEKWYSTNPNRPTATEMPWVNEHCGVVLREGTIGDIACDTTLPFICEMEPGNLQAQDSHNSKQSDLPDSEDFSDIDPRYLKEFTPEILAEIKFTPRQKLSGKDRKGQ